jgi:hypothetical protein
MRHAVPYTADLIDMLPMIQSQEFVFVRGADNSVTQCCKDLSTCSRNMASSDPRRRCSRPSQATLIDSDGPNSLLRRDDLTFRASRTVWLARRP